MKARADAKAIATVLASALFVMLVRIPMAARAGPRGGPRTVLRLPCGSTTPSSRQKEDRAASVVQLNNTSAFSDKVKWRPPANLRCMIKGPLCAELKYPLQFRLHADQRRKAGQGVDRLR